MSSREKVCWHVVTSEVDAAESHIRREYGVLRPYLSIYYERAIAEWLDRDRLADLEALVERFEDVCSHSLPSFSRATFSFSDDPDTDPVQIHIHSELADEFRRVVDEKTDYRNQYGKALSIVLHQYRTGGRVGRLEDRLERLIDAETGEEADTYDPDAQGIHYNDVNLHELDKRTRTYQRYLVCQNLDPDADLHMNDVRDAVRENVQQGDAPAKDDKFIREILSTLNYVPHPNNPSSGIYVSEARADELTEMDTAASADLERIADIDRGDFTDLSKPERLTKIRLAMVRSMSRRGQKTRRFDYTFIKNRVFENHKPSPAYANKAIKQVETSGGAISFTTKHDKKGAQVNRDAFAEECPTVWAYIQNELQREREQRADASGETEPAIATDGGREGGRR